MKDAKEEDHDQIILPFGLAESCMLSDFGGRFARQEPVLIFQSKEYQIVGYKFRQKAWHHCFTVEGRKFRLDLVFNRNLVGLNMKDRMPTLLEIGGRNDSDIITEMEITKKGDMSLEACSMKTDYLLEYQKLSQKF